MDPTIVAAGIGAAGKAAEALLGGGAQSGGPQSSAMDGSGWTVATGGSNATASRSGSDGLGFPGMSSDLLMWAALGLLAVLAVRKLKR